MYASRADFDVTKGRLQNQGRLQGVCCNTVDHCFYTICGVAIHRVKLPGKKANFVTAP